MGNEGKSYHNGLIPVAHYPYVSIVLNNGVSFTQNPSDHRPDYFVSLEHKRYTSTANTVTVSISYVPTGNADPNDLEVAIRDSKGIFKFQYGSSKGINMSPVYVAMAYDYSVNIMDGYLSYTISGVSRSIIANYDNLKDNALGINCDFVGTADSVEAVLDKMDKVVKNSDLNKYCVFDKENSAKTFKVHQETPVSGKTPMNFLFEVASNLRDSEDEKSHFYKIIVSDVDDANNGGKSKIRLIRTGTAEVGKYVFQWGGKNTDVISWRPTYQGAYAIFNDNNNGYGNLVNTFDGDSSGNPTAAKIQTFDTNSLKESLSSVSALASTSSVSLSSAVALSVTQVQDFREKVTYPYKAQLTVLGIGGDELLLGYSLIKVSPYINGKTHHTAGDYVVTGVTDKVDSSSGFTTTLDLYRYVKDESAKTREETDQEGSHRVNPEGALPDPNDPLNLEKRAEAKRKVENWQPIDAIDPLINSNTSNTGLPPMMIP